MELNVNVSFQQLLTIVKTLSPVQKTKLRAVLNEDAEANLPEADFIEYLLKGPVYSDEEIQTIEENRKSIAIWRTLD